MNTSLPAHSFSGIGSCRTFIQNLIQTRPDLGLTPVLNLQQCYKYCGTGYGSYNTYDALEAITTWVIPLLQLAANTNSIDSARYFGKAFVFFHQFADPIGTTWNLALKLDLGRRLQRHCEGLELGHLKLSPLETKRARRDLANLFYSLHDFGHADFEVRVNRLCSLVQGPEGKKYYHDIRSVSLDLALARTRNIIPTFAAISVYLAAAFATLLRSDQNSSLIFAQPHTIALRVLCYFLLLQIVLSSAVGGWPSQWTPQSFLKKLGERLQDHDSEFRQWERLGEVEIELWDGGLYTFGPPRRSIAVPLDQHLINDTLRFSSQAHGRRQTLLLSLAFFSLFSSFAIAFLMSWFTPTVGLGGRGIAELTYFSVWIINFFINDWLTRCIKNGKTLFTLVLGKDKVISLLVMLFFFLPFLGWYNSCDSWSAVFSLGPKKAYINLDLESIEHQRTWSLYFTGIAVGTAVQAMIALVIIWMNFDAIRLSLRTEREIREELGPRGPVLGRAQTGAMNYVLPPVRPSTTIELNHLSQLSSTNMTETQPLPDSQTRLLERGHLSAASLTSEAESGSSESMRRLLDEQMTSPLTCA